MISISRFCPWPRSRFADWWGSRSTTRRPGSWRRCVLAIYVGIGMTWTFNAGLGERYHRMAFSQPNLARQLLMTMRATSVYPLSSRIRNQAAMFHAILDQIPPLVALIELNRALEDAPHDPHLMFWRIVQLIRYGDLTTAKTAVERLETMLPNWAKTRRARALLNQETSK